MRPSVVRGSLVLLVAALPAIARAGDPPAHQEAARRASVIVAQQFPNGVGAPEFQIDQNALWDPDTDITTAPVNAPDFWGCEDDVQPPAMSAANDAIMGPTTAFLANQLNIAEPMLAGQVFPVAMTCNYNHFVSNPALGPSSQVANALATVQAWVRAEYTMPISQGDQSLCTAANWKDYWSKVLFGLHYVQDPIAEQHQIGNKWCSAANVAGGSASIGIVPTFIRTELIAAAGAHGRIVDDSCTDFLASGLAAVASGNLDCDAAVTATNAAALSALCLAQFAPPACMGLERLIRHHCFYNADRPSLPDGGVPRAVHCSGGLMTSCEDPQFTCTTTTHTTYCEGELCLGAGTVDFVSAATTASVPYLATMATEWAMACGCGGAQCGSGSVCVNCGSGDMCEPAGTPCCGSTACGAGQECCGATGSPTCVTQGTCCGSTVCPSDEYCLDCSDGGIDAGMPDAGGPDAGGGDAGNCPPTSPIPDAGPPATSVVSRSGTCSTCRECCESGDCNSAGLCCSQNGSECGTDSDCCTTACTGGTCCNANGDTCSGNADCCSGLICESGRCTPGCVPLQGTCSNVSQCCAPASQYPTACTNQMCCQPPEYPGGGHYACLTDDECCAPGMCTSDGCAIPLGSSCTDSMTCEGNYGVWTDSQCVNNTCCASPEGICHSDSDCCGSPSGMTCNGQLPDDAICYLPAGASGCTKDTDCGFGYGGSPCTNGTCCFPGGVTCFNGAAACCSGICGSGGYCQ